MKRIFKALIAGLLISGNFLTPVWADQTVEERLADLEQQVAILKRQIENNKEDTTTKAKDTPIITANAKDGFSIKSADDAYKLKIGGYVQADARIFTDGKNQGNTDTFLARRVRPIISGTVARDFDFYLMPDLAGSGGTTPQIIDAYAEYKYFPGFKVRGGKFKVPFSIESLQPTTVTNFAELGLPSNLYPNRDVGFQVSGDVLKDRLSYAVGVFNGSTDGQATSDTDTNNDKNIAGRIFVQPFKNTAWEDLKGFGIGYAATLGHQEGNSSTNGIGSYKSPGQVSVFSYASATSGAANAVTANGPLVRTSPQVYFYRNSLGLLGEYVSSRQELTRNNGAIKDKFNNTAWQLSGSYVLTGELASYKGVTPRTDFDPSKGTWGAFELVGRYGELKIDSSVFDEGFANLNTAISKEQAWAAGFNWYLNKNTKLMFDFEQTKFTRGVADNLSGGNRKPENVVTSRLQLSF